MVLRKSDFSIGIDNKCGVSPLCELDHRAVAGDAIRAALFEVSSMFNLPPGMPLDAHAITRCRPQCPGKQTPQASVKPLMPEVVVNFRPADSGSGVSNQ